MLKIKMWRQRLVLLLAGFLLLYTRAAADEDDDQLGLGRGGYLNLTTRHFEAVLVRDAQVLASLRPSGSAFDFLPFDYLPRRARHGQYHWGDITFRYRTAGAADNGGDAAWIEGDSAAARRPVVAIDEDNDDDNVGGVDDTKKLTTAHMGPTLPQGPLNVTREWLDVAGDLGLRFTVTNAGAAAVEVGSLGFPAEFNSIFTGRDAADMARVCSLADPYIGLHAGHLRVAPARGDGPALVVTPLGDAPLEAYRNLAEPYHDDTAYGSQTFEGFYEWQVLSKAWAENEWRGTQPWNPPSSRILQPGESMTLGVRFSVVPGGVREMDTVVGSTGTPVALGVPGFIIPRGSAASLHLRASSEVRAVTAAPAVALAVRNVAAGVYAVTPAATAWGRVRLDVVYADDRVQTVHYFVTKPGTEAVGDLGRFATTAQWFNDTSDPFGRAPSIMTYDYEARAIVTQDARAWVAGLSDEGGAGSFLAVAMKQAVQPDAAEVAKLEQFVDGVLWKTIQTPDYSVRKSIFFYDPEAVPDYPYDAAIDWTSWTSWNKEAAYATDRAYDYVHVAATYWALYRVARAYPALVSHHTWDWYLTQAYRTIARGMQADVEYNRVGLMGETVFGEILADLHREEKTPEADDVTEKMRDRALQWDSEEVPFGSEMAWDSTGQEGVYYWSKYFGLTATATKTVNSVLGFMPTVPHWGWDGNARRYWDNVYAGKFRRIERQIHHYGSGLNALVLLSAFRSDPSDTYLLRVGYGGASGPVSSIHQDGFAAASFHSWPETLEWDGYSGDYGPNFVGLALGSGTYLADMDGVGLVAFGGTIAGSGGGSDDDTGAVVVTTTDPVRRRIFIGPLGVLVTVDAGIIRAFRYWPPTRRVEVTLSQLEGSPEAAAAVVWVENPSGLANYTMTAPEMVRERLGWRVPLSAGDATVTISPQ